MFIGQDLPDWTPLATRSLVNQGIIISRDRRVVMSKPFSMMLDRKIGNPAEHKVRDWLWMQPGVQHVERFPFGQYDVDLAALWSGSIVYVEVERRTNWTGRLFPYNTIHIPARKMKMIFTREPLLYFQVRYDLEMAAVLEGQQILSSDVECGYNRLMRDTLDTFFNVPAKEIRYEQL